MDLLYGKKLTKDTATLKNTFQESIYLLFRVKSIIMKELSSFAKWIHHVETSAGDVSLINYSHVKEIFIN